MVELDQALEAWLKTVQEIGNLSLAEQSRITQAGFRAVLFRMVPKRVLKVAQLDMCFRAVLFRMVPKQ